MYNLLNLYMAIIATWLHADLSMLTNVIFFSIPFLANFLSMLLEKIIVNYLLKNLIIL